MELLPLVSHIDRQSVHNLPRAITPTEESAANVKHTAVPESMKEVRVTSDV